MYELGGPLGDRSVPPGTNLLIIGPPLSDKRELGFDLIAHGLGQDEAAVVLTTTDPASRVQERLSRRDGVNSATVGIVDCVSKHQGLELDDEATHATAPDDMTGAGIGLADHLGTYEDGEFDGIRVLVSTLSPLLIYANVETAFRFLHVCTTRTTNADGIGIHLLDANVHDEATVSTVMQLYDGVIRTSGDGEPKIASLLTPSDTP